MFNKIHLLTRFLSFFLFHEFSFLSFLFFFLGKAERCSLLNEIIFNASINRIIKTVSKNSGMGFELAYTALLVMSHKLCSYVFVYRINLQVDPIIDLIQSCVTWMNCDHFNRLGSRHIARLANSETVFITDHFRMCNCATPTNSRNLCANIDSLSGYS